MKKMFYKLLSLLVMIPNVVYADEIGPLLPEPNGESNTFDKDFTIVFICIVAISALIVIITKLKNKKGK